MRIFGSFDEIKSAVGTKWATANGSRSPRTGSTILQTPPATSNGFMSTRSARSGMPGGKTIAHGLLSLLAPMFIRGSWASKD